MKNYKRIILLCAMCSLMMTITACGDNSSNVTDNTDLTTEATTTSTDDIVTEAASDNASENGSDSLTGIWEYSDTENGIKTVYDLKDDGTGTYTMTVGDNEVIYELKYEVKDGHLLVTYVNNDTFTEDDVFDNEFSFKDSNTIIIKDSNGEELTYIKK